MNNGRPYKYNSKDRLKKPSNRKKNNKNLDNTIKIDEERLNDLDLLDTSFLEGRLESHIKKSNLNNKNKSKSKVKSKKQVKKEKDKQIISSSALLSRIHFLRNLFLSLAVVCIFILVTVLCFNFFKKTIANVLERHLSKKEDVEEVVVKPDIDYNYLFVGDYFTDEFLFQKYGLDYHYVKSGERDLTSERLLNNSKKLIYEYNPSHIFIEVGLFDINNGVSNEDFLTNMKNIIYNIKRNRPKANIYIESIYPINNSIEGYDLKSFSDDVTNEKINNLNNALKELCVNKGVSYVDINDMLSKSGKLDASFTDNGYELNNRGYKQVYKTIMRELGE